MRGVLLLACKSVSGPALLAVAVVKQLLKIGTGTNAENMKEL